MKFSIKFLRTVLFIGTLFTCFSASQASWAQSGPIIPLLKDLRFEQGLTILKPAQGSRVESGIRQTVKKKTTPVWEVAQWGSRFDLMKGVLRKGAKGEVHFIDSAKSISIYPDNRFSLRLNGWVEYGAKPRVFFQSWPHLYLEQNFEPDMFISRFSKIPFHLEGRHLYTRNYLGEKMSNKLHTSQLIVQFFLVNKNKASAGYNQEKVILSLPVYDYRWDYRSRTAFLDAGTKKTVTNTFVYGPAGKGLWSGSFRNDTINWHTMECDLLPHLWEAFRAAKKEGYFSQTRFEDLALVNFVFGWEMPGTFDSEMEFRNMSLFGVLKPASALKPNIALIIADDLGWEDLGCYGNTDVQTPNIDELARNGIRFRNGYVTASSCSPSRISILTGRYPHNTGAAELHTEVLANQVFFPELLRKQGYYTGLSGKFHEGRHTRRAYDTLFVNRKDNGPGGEANWVNLLDNRDPTKPFFFWLSAVDPHRDWELTASERVHDPRKLKLPPNLKDDSQTRQDLASYYDEIARMDRYVGEFINRLKALGLYEQTIIVFLSDNGRAFPGAKCLLNDQGVKTPLIVSIPPGLKGKTGVSDALLSSVDIAPTILSLADVQPSPNFQGSSFARVLEDPSAPFRHYVFAEQNWHDFEGYQRMVRDEQFMYIVNKRAQKPLAGPLDVITSPSYLQLRESYRAGKSLTPFQQIPFVLPPEEALYDLTKDPYQLTNLANDPSYQQQLINMRKKMEEWKDTTGDTEPRQLTADWYNLEDGKKLPAHGVRGEMPGTRLSADQIIKPGPF